MADDKTPGDDVPDSPDVYFEPLVNLPPVETRTLEENEQEMLKMRAKLFRYDSVADPPEWKERGVGDVKILKNKKNHTCRVLMRRDKTLKICANHYVLPNMELLPNCGSERAWVWSTPSDYADEEVKTELLAIRFANAENAQKFREKFEDAKELMAERETHTRDNKEEINGTSHDTASEKVTAKVTDEVTDKVTDEVTDTLGKLAVTDEQKSATSPPATKTSDKSEPDPDPADTPPADR